MGYSSSETDCSSMGPPQVAAPARKPAPLWALVHKLQFLPGAFSFVGGLSVGCSILQGMCTCSGIGSFTGCRWISYLLHRNPSWGSRGKQKLTSQWCSPKAAISWVSWSPSSPSFTDLGDFRVVSFPFFSLFSLKTTAELPFCKHIINRGLTSVADEFSFGQW